jgi:hypothetical protein
LGSRSGRQCARPQLPFRAWLVQVPFAVKQRTHLSCFTFVLEQAIKRRVCVHWRVVKEWCQASSSAIYLLIVIFTPQTFSILTRARKLPARSQAPPLLSYKFPDGQSLSPPLEPITKPPALRQTASHSRPLRAQSGTAHDWRVGSGPTVGLCLHSGSIIS